MKKITSVLWFFVLVALVGGLFSPGMDARAAGTCAREYTVAAGDTLYKIAYSFGVSLADLAAANDLKDPYWIYAGQVLCIPGATSTASTTSSSSLATAKASRVSAAVDGSLLDIKASNLTKKSIYFVKIRSVNGRFQGVWYKLGLLNMGKNTSREASYRLPRVLREKASLEVCLKNVLTDDLYCTIVSP